MRLVVERLGHHGDGIAPGPEGAVFVPSCLPGEEVEGRLNGDRLEEVRILTPSPARVRPACSHARACGGCQLQHAAEPFVAGWKAEVVRQALAGQGLEAPELGFPVREGVATSPARSRRRAVFSGRRTKGGVQLGFHARGRDLIVPVPECRLIHPDLAAGLPALEALVALGGSRSTEVSLTVTQSLTGLDVSVRGGKAADAGLRMDLARLAERFGLARLTWEGETVALRHEPLVALGPARAVLPPGSFLQATAEGEAALLAAVREALGPQKRIADLFCGMGTFALPLAETMEVHGVEGLAALTGALERAARRTPGLKQVTTETRDLFRRPLEPDELNGFGAVVIDPPRAGAEAQVLRLARSKVPVVAMVSCNPVTFARDMRILAQGGYRLDWVQVVDQFRWSVHVELAARLSRD
ncbi:class I SAM-dependent RNA methyltransferase [Pseudogemmobacter sonorensis]|uniref:class I SAM-dependent RNA methyltransferase n=1 Tax=Pseudogemmobacter sonorensis TaxID=2989681 RepID=UPI0036AE4A6D